MCVYVCVRERLTFVHFSDPLLSHYFSELVVYCLSGYCRFGVYWEILDYRHCHASTLPFSPPPSHSLPLFLLSHYFPFSFSISLSLTSFPSVSLPLTFSLSLSLSLPPSHSFFTSLSHSLPFFPSFYLTRPSHTCCQMIIPRSVVRNYLKFHLNGNFYKNSKRLSSIAVADIRGNPY